MTYVITQGSLYTAVLWWYRWLADEQQRSFAFACPAGSFQARKERKQRGGWYWIAYRRAHGKIHKRYLGKPEELSPARLHAAAQLLERSAPPAAPPTPVDPGASPIAGSPAPIAAWPSGTVTFLFTDIVGSAMLWEQHPQAMPAALTRHNAILHDAVEAHDGVVFKTVGDSICAAFARPPAALAAALEAGRALHVEPWSSTGLPATRPIQVRMALHTGAAEPRVGDYLGPPRIVRGQLQTVRGWLNTVPDDLVRSRAWLCILHAITLLFTNQLAAAEARLQGAERCISLPRML